MEKGWDAREYGIFEGLEAQDQCVWLEEGGDMVESESGREGGRGPWRHLWASISVMVFSLRAKLVSKRFRFNVLLGKTAPAVGRTVRR